jgi:hypothetical protein
LALLSLLVSLLLLAFYVVSAPKYWRDEAGALSSPTEEPEWWSFSATKWHGVQRSFVAYTPFLTLAMLLFAALRYLGEQSPLYDTLGWLVTASMAMAIALNVSITLWNRPKSLVPPHLRAEPGSREIRRRRRAR